MFQGTASAAGLYAYAYQIAVNNVDRRSGQPTSVNSASLQLQRHPVGADLWHRRARHSAAYVITDGQVGGLDLPAAAPGSVIQRPTSVAWQPGYHDRRR